VSHDITVLAPSGRAGGRRSSRFSALSTRWASGQPPIPPRRSAGPFQVERGRSSRRQGWQGPRRRRVIRPEMTTVYRPMLTLRFKAGAIRPTTPKRARIRHGTPQAGSCQTAKDGSDQSGRGVPRSSETRNRTHACMALRWDETRKKPRLGHPCPGAACRRGSRLAVLRRGLDPDGTQAVSRSALPLATGPLCRGHA
jgi:hypothetical protein